MDRRETLRWVLAAGALPWLRGEAFGDVPTGPGQAAGQPAPPVLPAEPATDATVSGYGSDPDLARHYRPGDVWPLTLTPAQRRAAAALCDVLIPADEHSPAASAVGIVDFLDEWVSAPYPSQQRDRPMVLDGLTWLDAEAGRRYAKDFAAAAEDQQHAICDDICHATNAKPEFAQAAAFFARYRDLTAGGFYSTPAGCKDLGYVGNVPLARFDGPPAELLRKLGLGPVST